MRDVLEGMQAPGCDVRGETTVPSGKKPACQQAPLARIIPFPTRR